MSIELAIRARRAAFNRAIAEGDTAAIGPLLTRDCVMITGTDSAVIAGRVTQVKVWRREFSAVDRLIYVRTPSLITPLPVEPIAMEQGEWRGSARQADGEVSEAHVAFGTYAAKWRELGGLWMIEAEIFVTLE